MNENQNKLHEELQRSVVGEGTFGKGFMSEKRDLLKDGPVTIFESEVVIPIISGEEKSSSKTNKNGLGTTIVSVFILLFIAIVLWKYTKRKPK